VYGHGAELLIDLEEDKALRAMLVRMLREHDRRTETSSNI
jgi:hypothetical protein